MAASAYRILDEPSPGALACFVVNPFWPLLSLMLAGPWIAWPWFAFNSFALGSATLRRELLLLAGAVVTSLLVLFALAWAVSAGWIGEPAFPYTRIAVYVGKLMFAYLLFAWQERALSLFEYFDGQPRNGVLVVVAAMFADRSVERLLGDSIAGVVLL